MHKSIFPLNLVLLNAGFASVDTSWNYDRVMSPFTRLYFVTRGKAKVKHHNKVYQLLPGFLYLIPAHSLSSYHCAKSMGHYYIHFMSESENQVPLLSVLDFVYEAKATDTDRILFEKLMMLHPNRALVKYDPKAYDNPPSLLNFKSLNDKLTPSSLMETNGVLHILLSRFVKAQPHDAETLDLNTQRINKTLAYIHNNLSSPLSVEVLAKEVYLQSDYFSRLFLAKMGIRPMKYINMKRVERAQLLLATTEKTLQQIAEEVGFCHVAHLSRRFQQITGKPPGIYRKENLWSFI